MILLTVRLLLSFAVKTGGTADYADLADQTAARFDPPDPRNPRYFLF